MGRTAHEALALLMLAGCASNTTPQTPTAQTSTSQTTERGGAQMVEQTHAVVEVPLSSGNGWSCEDKEFSEPLPAFVAKCVHEEGEPLFLMSKVYVVPPDQVVPAKRLVDEIYPKNYAKLFDRFQITETKPATIQGHEGVDVFVEAVSGRGPARVHERVVVDGTSVFIITQMGSVKAFEDFADLRARWLAETRFRGLAKN